MTYLELLQTLEHRLGYQHLPLNPRATTLKQIFEGSPVHHDLMTRVAQALYTANACRQLTDPVDKETCFAAIGPVRQDALKTASTDVDTYHLLDDLCHAMHEAFTPTPAATAAAAAAPDVKRQADVIQLNVRRRRHDKE